MCIDTPAPDVTQIVSTNWKCPPSENRAADMAAVSRCSDEPEYQDHGGKELTGCRYGLETDVTSTNQTKLRARRCVHQRKHTNAQAGTEQTLAHNSKTKQTKRLPNRTEAPRETLYYTS